MIKIGLKKLMLDYSVFTKNLSIGKIIIVIVNIDNFFFCRPELIKVNIIKSFLLN